MLDWSSSPVRVGAFMLTLGGGALLGDVVQSSLLAGAVAFLGFALMVMGTWWWKRGFKFPRNLKPSITVLEDGKNRVWGVDLEVNNPGRTDRFVARIENIRGAKAPSSAVGTYPNWRGEIADDAKLIRRGDSAIFALCSWDRQDDTGTESQSSFVSTVNASTGSVPVTLTEAGAKYDGLDRYELVYQLVLVSDKTEKKARYAVHVGPISIADPAPRVQVERVK